MSKPAIIIIGGGVCGLMAARILSSSHNVTLIEQGDKLGGRVRTFHSGDNIIEAGAEFMHGDLPLTKSLLDEAGLHYVKAEGRMLKKEGKELKEQTEMLEGWDEFYKKVRKEAVDITLDNFLDKHFADNRHEKFREEVRRYAIGFDVADPKDVSVLSLYNEWSHEGTNYRIKEGYGAMIDFLERECRNKNCNIILNETVKQVKWQRDNVTVITDRLITYTANKVLITVPVSIISNASGACAISFSNPIDEYIIASKQIGFGAVIKIIVEFDVLLWKTGTAFIFSEEKIPTWWTQYPLDGNTLTGWVGGPMADKLADQSDDNLLVLAVESLANIFDVSVEDLKANIMRSHVFNWKRYVNVRGAYSYATTQSRIARKMMNTPIENTIFFAGEGIYDGEHSGTVEAALISAKQTYQKIVSSQS